MKRMRRTALGLGAALALMLVLAPAASAHGLIQRKDLPVPDWLFGWAASLVLVVSFVGLSLAWHQSRFEDERWRPAPSWLSTLMLNRIAEILAGAIGVFLLGVIVWSGLYGTEAPDRNVSVTLVFVTAWLGFVVFSVFLGDVFRPVNPWRAIGRIGGAIFKAIAGASTPAPVKYPERLGRWPAACGLLAFAWLELAYGAGGFQVVGLTPHTVAVATLVYTAYTLVAMALFGTDKWLERGETFSVYFGMFARMAPISAREGRLGFRRPLSGLTSWAMVPGSAAVVLVAIGSTAFDGASEGILLEPTQSLYEWFESLGLSIQLGYRLATSILMAATIAVVVGFYWAGIMGMHTVRNRYSTSELGRLFAHAFVPIALAYLVAHYFTLFVFQEQAQFGYLLSDPLGDGSDYFGTAASGIDYGFVGGELVWYVQVGALIVGHVLALILGHDRALRLYESPKLAARSQYWMLAMMVGFTSLGLFLLSQVNG